MTPEEKRQSQQDSIELVSAKLSQARREPGYIAKMMAVAKDAQKAADHLNSGRHPSELDFMRLIESNDPYHLNLPHPVRAVQLGRSDINTAMMAGPQTVADLWAMAQYGCGVNEALMYLNLGDTDELRSYRHTKRKFGGQVDDDLASMVFPLFHDGAGGTIFEFTNQICDSLYHTDISEEVPCQFVRPPHPIVYFEFGDKNSQLPLIINNVETGEHQLQGVYIIERQVSSILSRDRSNEILGIDPDGELRMLNLMFVGRAKSNMLDDATFHLTLFIQDDAMPVGEMIRRHMAHYTDQELVEVNAGLFGDKSPSRNLHDHHLHSLVMWLTKTLLYLNCADVRRELKPERSDMAKKIAALGPKKVAKAKRKMEGTYDRVMISTPASEPLFSGGGDGKRHVSAHFRRGHIRMQRHGEGRAQVKPVFIKPMLINSSALGTQKPKNYIVK